MTQDPALPAHATQIEEEFLQFVRAFRAEVYRAAAMGGGEVKGVFPMSADGSPVSWRVEPAHIRRPGPPSGGVAKKKAA